MLTKMIDDKENFLEVKALGEDLVSSINNKKGNRGLKHGDYH